MKTLVVALASAAILMGGTASAAKIVDCSKDPCWQQERHRDHRSIDERRRAMERSIRMNDFWEHGYSGGGRGKLYREFRVKEQMDFIRPFIQ